MICFQFSSYEPELFPGLIYRCSCREPFKLLLIFDIIRMVKPRIVLLIFVSGKVVLTGAKVSIFLVLETLLTWSVSGANRNL